MFKLDMQEEVLWSWFLFCLIVDNDCSFIGYALSLINSLFYNICVISAEKKRSISIIKR